jgi:MSHA pilin protein MshC
VKAAGFSLIELLVIMVIAGILAAIAIPRLTDTEIKASWYADEVAATVRFAQRQAVAQRRSVFVCVQAGSLSVGYDAACTGAAPQSGAIIQIPQQLVAPGTTTLNPNPTFFSFNALGQPNPIGGASISVSGTGRSVNVTGETGYVVVN